MSSKLLSVTKQISILSEKKGKCVFSINSLSLSSFFLQSLTSTKSNWVQIILREANIICPALEINGGKSSELCANLIPRASGELNKAVGGSGAEGGRGCESSQPPLLGEVTI